MKVLVPATQSGIAHQDGKQTLFIFPGHVNAGTTGVQTLITLVKLTGAFRKLYLGFGWLNKKLLE
jgi:hypothetical protein